MALLTGTYPRSLDDKLRLVLPKRVRDGLVPSDTTGGAADPSPEVTAKEVNVYLTPGTDGCLAIYPEAVFHQLGQQLSQASPVAHDVRTFSRLFYAQAECLEMDTQGRVRIPQTLAQWAGLTKEVVLLGVRDHVEIWDRATWERYLASRLDSYDEVAERALGGATMVAPLPNTAATHAPTTQPDSHAGPVPAGDSTAGPPRRPR